MKNPPKITKDLQEIPLANDQRFAVTSGLNVSQDLLSAGAHYPVMGSCCQGTHLGDALRIHGKHVEESTKKYTEK